MSKLNKIYWGLLAGATLPLMFGALFLWTLHMQHAMPIERVVQQMSYSGQMLFKLFIVSISPNLFAIFFAYKKELWQLCSGLISATLIYFTLAIIMI